MFSKVLCVVESWPGGEEEGEGRAVHMHRRSTLCNVFMFNKMLKE